jgi:hypothetical protein
MARAGAVLLAWLLAGCATSRDVSEGGPAAPNEADAALDAAVNEGGDDASGCLPPHQAPRTWVAFSEGMMGLEDFSLAAYESERILAMLPEKLCALTPEQDPEGSLREALAARLQLEIFKIEFTRDDAGSADLYLRVVSEATESTAADAGAPPSWVVRLVRDLLGWRLLSARPE